MAANTPRRRSLVWPIILVGLGVILLLQNFGLFPWDFWTVISRFWPVVLILIGIELLLNRGNPALAGLVAIAFVAVVIVGGVVAASLGYANGWSAVAAWPDKVQLVTTSQDENYSEPLGSNSRATVDINYGAGSLAVAALPRDSGSLVEAAFSHQGSNRAVNHSFRCVNGDCTLRLSEDHSHWPFSGGGGPDEWNVALTPQIPLNVQVRAGASHLDLDLTALQVTALRLDAGASNGTIKLPPGLGATSATIKAGAATLDLIVPDGAAARIHTRGGLSTFNVDAQRFTQQGDYYVTSNYGTTQNRLDLDVEAGVATISVR